MRKRCILYPFIIILIVGGGLAVRYLPGIVPYWQCSEVYKRYKDVEGVRATYIKDYRVNDTLTVGVTLLEATDSAGWEYLVDKFNIPQELREIKGIDVWTWKSLSDQPEKRYKKNDADCRSVEGELWIEIVAISTKSQEIIVFHTRNAQEQRTVFHKKIESNI